MTPSPFKALFYSFICALLFGSAFPAIKTVFGHWESRGLEIGLFSIWLFAGIRFMIAGIGLLCAAKQPFIELKNTPWRLLLLFTLGQTLLQYLFFYLAVCRTSFCENSIFYPELNPAASEPTYLMTI
jgi:drug/metabolite transporter (DMT)-like permease